MKKTLIASAIAVSLNTAGVAHANLTVTSMDFGANYGAEGSINDDGTLGLFNSTEDFFYNPWFATQETAVITNSNGVTWAGTVDIPLNPANGSFDFAADIALMTDDQVAIGAFFDWNTSQDIAVLAVFDCVSVAGTCTGQTTGEGGVMFGGMQNGSFIGSVPAFNGTGNLSAIPVPAAVWLMGSGLIGLVGVARRKKRG